MILAVIRLVANYCRSRRKAILLVFGVTVVFLCLLLTNFNHHVFNYHAADAGSRHRYLSVHNSLIAANNSGTPLLPLAQEERKVSSKVQSSKATIVNKSSELDTDALASTTAIQSVPVATTQAPSSSSATVQKGKTPSLNEIVKRLDTDKVYNSVNGTNYFDLRTKELYALCKQRRSEIKLEVACKNNTAMHFINAPSVVACASFPGSGSTWFRMIMQQATGIFTGSVYCDSELKGKGFLGEKLSSNNVLFVKTHYPDTELFVPCSEYYDRRNCKDISKGILLIRNPLDAFVAEWKRQRAGHVGDVSSERFGSNASWRQFIKNSWKEYERLVHFWIEQSNVSLLVIKFEDLKRDLVPTVEKVLDFLEVRYTREEINCVAHQTLDDFKRKKKFDFDPYMQTDRAFVWEKLMALQPLLDQHQVDYRTRNDTTVTS